MKLAHVSPRALLVCALALVAWHSASCSGERAERKPNVVVVLIDTLRPDHLPAYGYQHATTPYLAELAARGVVFENAYSASTWTAPATASLFTGLYPNQHGITEGFFVHMARTARSEGEPQDAPQDEKPAEEQDEKQDEKNAERGSRGDMDRWEGPQASTVSLNRIPDALATVPELFARAGYATFGASANVNITARIGFDRGFAHFADFTGPEHGKGAAAELIRDQVRQWEPKMRGDAPYFLYLHLNDAHAPRRERAPLYQPDSAPFAAERAAYDGELRYLDGVLRELSQELKWDDQTLVCVLSDHGEEFGEHGGTGHGYSIHSELMRIALFFAWPAQLPGGRRIETPVSIVDVLPTLAQLAGLGPVNNALAGVSLAPSLAGRAAPPERTLFALRFREGGVRQLWAAQRGQWKLILSGKGPQLFDHASDPFEKRNVAAEHPELVASLMAELKAFRALEPAAAGAKVNVQLDEGALKALRELGYTDAK